MNTTSLAAEPQWKFEYRHRDRHFAATGIRRGDRDYDIVFASRDDESMCTAMTLTKVKELVRELDEQGVGGVIMPAEGGLVGIPTNALHLAVAYSRRRGVK